VITLHELNKKIKEMTGLTPDDLRSQNEKNYLETRRKILELLIDERIAQAKIQELGINVSEKRIDATIENIKKVNRITHEDLIAKLKSEGITYEKYREKVKEDLERLNLINSEVKSKIIIREEQLSQYYDKHKEEFSSVGEVHLASIFLMKKDPKDEDEIQELSQKGETILARLRKGEDFAKLAKEFSQGPGANEGGDLGLFKTDQLEPLIRKILDNLPEGGISDLMVRPNGIQIIKLIERKEAKVKSFEEVRDAIYANLYNAEVNKRYMSWIKGLRKSYYTKITF
jgi:peptidyl-prolyl cis-trans isomerase SurA